ncbi:MAG: ribbon-helix-helix protein, CopG family [archaeon]|nr:ribbon-helix-helix protein, CopG family [archaeon]
MKKSKKKEFLGVRLEEELMIDLDKYAQKYKVSRSVMARRAISEWANYFEPLRDNRTMIFDKNLIQFLLNIIKDESDFEKLAEIGYKNSIDGLAMVMSNPKVIQEMVKDLSKYKITSIPTKYAINLFLETLVTNVYSREGQNWFDEELKYSWNKNDRLVIEGIHNMNKNYSIFIKLITEKMFKTLFDFQIAEEILKENKLVLAFEAEINGKNSKEIVIKDFLKQFDVIL